MTVAAAASSSVACLTNFVSTQSIAALRASLRTHGYCRILVDDPELLRGVNVGLDEASRLRGFRFPPIDVQEGGNGEADGIRHEYNDASRRCFRSLFEVAVRTFAAVSSGTALPRPLEDALRRCEHDDDDRRRRPPLFGPAFDRHEPFEDPVADPFGQSFFNLFNYDHGLLNPHKDRGLLTVIASRKPSPLGAVKDDVSSVHPSRQSALWVRTPCDGNNGGEWENIDETLNFRDGEVAIFLGEDSERLPFSEMYGLKAVEHAVRVDPAGDYIMHSHFRPDPDTVPRCNRVSAALILKHDF